MRETSYTKVPTENAESSIKNEKCSTKASVLRLTLIGFIVITPAITPGMAMSYSSIALRQLDLNLDQSSWFVSIMSIATPFGNFFTGFIIDRCGRRKSLIWSVIPSILGWFLLSIHNASIPTLYIGRLLTGFALGMASLPSTVYIAECIVPNELSIRGSFAAWTTLAISSGVLLSFIFGVFFYCTEVALIAGLISTASLFSIIFFIPESPVWLHRKGKIGDALHAQLRLGIAQPILSKKRERTFSENDSSIETEFSIRSLIHFASKIKKKEVYKPFLITVSFLFFLQFSGIYAITGYMVDIIEVKSIDFSPYVLAVISGVLQCIAVIATTFIIPYSGVKNISILSTSGTALGLFLLGFSEIYSNYFPYSYILDWIHVVSVWFTILAASLGFVVIPFSILGEMFPMGAKSYASVSLVASSAFNFIILKIHPIFYFCYGGLIYLVYGVIAFSGMLFVILFLPETVGKTLEEIKDGFKRVPELNDVESH